MAKTTQAQVNSFFAPRKKEAEPEPSAKEEIAAPPAKKQKVEAVEANEVKTEGNDNGVQAKPGEPIPYKLLTDTFEKCDQTTKRLEISKYCGECFLEVLRANPQDLHMVVYLFINRLGPEYEGLELGLGESLIIKSLAEATGRKTDNVKKDYKEEGDLGKVAMKSRSKQSTMIKPKPLNVTQVFKDLKKIATTTGNSSQKDKTGVIKKLLTACSGTEPKYLVRSLEGKLRIGVQERTVIIGLSQAFVEYEKEQTGKEPCKPAEAEAMISEAYSQLPNYEKIIDAVLEHGMVELNQHCKLTPGIPLQPMLAKASNSVSELLTQFQDERFTCEYKYDGQRAQIHCTEDGKFSVFSRNLEDMSGKYPDILDMAPQLKKQKGVSSFVIDCEAVAWDREQKKILPFQVLSTRKRKDVEAGNITVRVCLFAFDLLYLNGKPVLNNTLQERRDLLQAHFSVIPGEFAFATWQDSSDTEEIQQFLDQSIRDGCEGLMIKALDKDSGYEPSKRSRNWLKLKKDYLEGVGDTLDLVILGGFYGKGKRTGWYGGFLLGCYNQSSEEYETICKIGTGFSEEDLKNFHALLQNEEIEKKKQYYNHDTGGPTQPDVWFEPKVVIEVLTADLSLSPTYRAGINELDRGKGVSLRFPRFIKYRDDKTPQESTSSDRVVEFYQKQFGV